MYYVAIQQLYGSQIVFFSLLFVNVYAVHLYSSMDTATAWKKFCFIVRHSKEIICMQGHGYLHRELEIKYHDTKNDWTFVSSSTLKNSIKATIEDGGVSVV